MFKGDTHPKLHNTLGTDNRLLLPNYMTDLTQIIDYCYLIT